MHEDLQPPSRPALPPLPWHLESGAATHVGRRENNEDAYVARPDLGLFAVADGLGGLEGGEVASALAVGAMADFIASAAAAPGEEAEAAPEALLLAALRHAEDVVRRHQRGRLSDMATTLSALRVTGSGASVCHVGDSRIYRWRDGQLQLLTRDQTALERLVEAGVTPSFWERQLLSNSLTGAVGMEGSAPPQVASISLQPDDVFLLCSDGLYGPVPAEELAEELAAVGPTQAVAERLVRRAHENGGTDNITAVVVRVEAR